MSPRQGISAQRENVAYLLAPVVLRCINFSLLYSELLDCVGFREYRFTCPCPVGRAARHLERWEMFDAEIAATLMNRWDDRRFDSSSVDLLNEGRLVFRRHTSNLDAMGHCGDLELEWLAFADGSHAVRLRSAGARARTRWAAIEPLDAGEDSA
jgi:hypothetical protein